MARLFSITVSLALAMGSPIAGTVRADSPGNFHVKAGIGYDFISQEYFYDSLRYGGVDTSLTSTLLTKEYLDDKKGLIYVKYDAGNERLNLFELGWEQTSDIVRVLGWGHLSLGDINQRLETDLRIEIKERYKGVPEAGEELDVIDGKISYQRRLSEQVTGKATVYREKVVFDLTDDYVYDYTRFGGQIDLSLLTAGFSSFLGSVAVERRNVPDSGSLDYHLLRGNLGFLGLIGRSQLTVDAGLESRAYKSEENRNDYFLYTGSSTLKAPLGRDFFLHPEASVEYYDFRSEQFLNEDYSMARLALLIGRDFERVTVNLGPKAELLAVASEYEQDDDYSEYLISAGIDYYSFGQVMIIFENQLGRRTYLNNPLFSSNFTFDRVSLIGNLKIFDGLIFDLLFSADWEWHDINSDDNRLYLVASGLTISF